MATLHTQTTFLQKFSLKKILGFFGLDLGPPLTKNGFTQEEEAEILRRADAPESEFIPYEQFKKELEAEFNIP